jgi:energy-coupling factor transporter ATP-binding protein EcfA2
LSSRAPEPDRPQRIAWRELRAEIARELDQDQSVAVVGPTGSGKTVLLKEIAKIRGERKAKDGHPARVTYLAAKPRDDSLDDLEWPVIKTWPPGYGRFHVIVWPTYGDPETAATRQRRVFRPLLKTIFGEGGQTVVIDEIAYFTDPLPDGLGLKTVIHQYLTVGRSNKLGLLGGTQRPRNVPRAFWSEPKWLFIFRLDDYDDLKRVHEIGGKRGGVDKIVAELEDYDFLVIRRKGTRRDLYISRVEVQIAPGLYKDPGWRKSRRA